MALNDRDYAHLMRTSAEIAEKFILPSLRDMFIRDTRELRENLMDMKRENNELKRRIDILEAASMVRFEEGVLNGSN
jgi:hypothetical protein